MKSNELKNQSMVGFAIALPTLRSLVVHFIKGNMMKRLIYLALILLYPLSPLAEAQYPSLGNGAALIVNNAAIEPGTTDVQFEGGVTIAPDSEDFNLSFSMSPEQAATIGGTIKVPTDNAHFGKTVDIFAVGFYSPVTQSCSGQSKDGQYYMLVTVPVDNANRDDSTWYESWDKNATRAKTFEEWDGSLDSLKPFQTDVALNESTPVPIITNSKFPNGIQGLLCISFGYRVTETDGTDTWIFNDNTIDISFSDSELREKPSFPGLITLTAVDTDSLTLSWLPATDDITLPDSMVYDIYVSDESNFTPTPATLQTTLVGENQTEVTGLAPETTYHVLVIAVDEEGNQSPEREYRSVKTLDFPVILNDSVEIYHDETLGWGKATQNGSEYSYENVGTELPKAGDILFAQVGEEIHLRKVLGITQTANGVVIQTTDASLSEVMVQGGISSNMKLFDVSHATDSSAVRNSTRMRSHRRRVRQGDEIVDESTLAFKDGGLTATQKTTYPNGTSIAFDSGIVLKPTIDFHPELITDVSWKKWSLQIERGEMLARGTLNLGATFQITAATTYEKEVDLWKTTYGALYWTTTVPPIPIYQEVTITIKAGMKLSASSEISTGATANATTVVELGLRYNPTTKQWKPVASSNFEKSFQLDGDTSFKAGLTLELKLIPELKVKFYKGISGSFSLEPYIKGEAGIKSIPKAELLIDHPIDFQLDKLDFGLGMEASVGAELKAVFKDITLFAKTKVFDLPILPLFSLPKIELLDGGNTKVGEPITLAGTIEDGVNNPFNDDSIQWYVYPENGSITQNSRTATFTPNEEGTYNVFFSGNSLLPSPLGRQFALTEVTVGEDDEEEDENPVPENNQVSGTCNSSDMTKGCVIVLGIGQDSYSVYDSNGYLTGTGINQERELFPGSYTITVNGSTQEAIIQAGQATVLQTGTISVVGTGQDNFSVYDSNAYLTGAGINQEREIFPGTYRITVNGSIQEATVQAGQATVLQAGTISVVGTGQDNFSVYDSNVYLTGAGINQEREIFPGTYRITVNGSTKEATVQAGQATVLQAGTLTISRGQRVYDASGDKFLTSGDGIIEIFPGTYMIKEGYGEDATSRTVQAE